MFKKMPHSHISTLVVSGNAVRKNPVLRQILAETFGLPLQIPAHTEEAAFGAALFAARGAGADDLRHCIKYQRS